MQYSIIIPVHNAEKTLERCLKSIVSQSFFDYEILLINNDSIDGSDAICRNYAEKYQQIRYLTEKDGTVSSTRNRGLEQARGEYILFVDSDDYVSENYFSVISDAIQEESPDLLMFGYRNMGGTSMAWSTGSFFEEKEEGIARRIAFAMQQYLFSSLCCKAFKRQIIEQNKIRFVNDLSIGEDQVFIFDYAMHIQSIASIEEILYNVDVGDNSSLSRRARPYLTEQLMKANRRIYRTYRKKQHSEEAAQFYEAALSWMNYRSAYSCCKELQKVDYSLKKRRQEIKKICKLYCNENIRPIGWKCKVIALPVRMRWSSVIELLTHCKNTKKLVTGWRKVMRFSIIVPVYNAEKTLERCLESIVNQPFSDYELLLINDGSTDGSDAICRSYSETYKQICYYSKENDGVSSARNLGLEQAKGDYILFVDSDDYVSENYFETISDALKDGFPDLLMFGYRNFGGTSTAWNTGIFFESDERQIAGKIASAMQQYLFSSLWSKAFKRQVIRQHEIRFVDDLSIGEDQVFIFTYAMHIQSIASIEEILYNVDVSDGNSLSRKTRPHLTEQLMEVNRRMYAEYRKTKHSKAASQFYEAALSWMFYRSAYSCCKELQKFDYSGRQRRLEIEKICKLYCAKRIRPLGWKSGLIAWPVRMRWCGLIGCLTGHKREP